MFLDIEKLEKEIEEKVRKELSKHKKHRKPLATLLNEAKGKDVRVFMMDGEILKGKLKKFSLYEIQVDDKIIWKQAIKYIEVVW